MFAISSALTESKGDVLKRTLKGSLADLVIALAVAAVASAALLGAGTLAVHHSAESKPAAAPSVSVYDH